jgi:protein TonB
MRGKIGNASLKLQYRKTLELGLVVSLIFHIFLMQGFKKFDRGEKKVEVKSDIMSVTEAPKTEVRKESAAPRRPTIPIASEDEELDESITMEYTDLNVTDETSDLPPPPEDFSDDQIVFVPHDEEPVPIGGFEAIQRRLVYPDFARKAGVEGKVLVYALIDVDGTVVNTKVMKSVVGCDDAAVNAIKAVKWKPAMQRDRPVKVWVMVPVEFKLK